MTTRHPLRLWPWHKPSPVGLRQGNLTCCDTTPLTQQSGDCSPPANAIATDLPCPDKRETVVLTAREIDSLPYKTFLFSYEHRGHRWSFTICATSPEDARSRLHRLPLARYDGELMQTIPATVANGLLVRFICWLGNVVRLIKMTLQ
jgi:hypothetical protein